MSINRIIISGRFSKKPKQAILPSGTVAANFVLAVDKPYRFGSGEPNWIPVSAYGHVAEYILNYCGKGDFLIVDGRLEHQQYRDKRNILRNTFVVIAESVSGHSKPKNATEDIVVQNTQEQQQPYPFTEDDFDPFAEDTE